MESGLDIRHYAVRTYDILPDSVKMKHGWSERLDKLIKFVSKKMSNVEP